MNDFPPDKTTLRKQCLAVREAVDKSYASSATEMINASILQVVSGSGIVVAGYRNIRGEVDISYAIAKLYENDHILCLPVVVTKSEPLRFRRWNPQDALVAGAYGIDVPEDHQPMVEPDVVLVPVVGFDARGHRLGYGAGYYDRTICALRERKKSVRIIGVAYSVQQVVVIPAEAHDARLDMVVTEKGVLKMG